MSEPHVHDWQPIQGWVGRYRCSVCRVIGYRGVTQPPVHVEHKAQVIFPYACLHSGCGRGAIQRKPQRCVAHVP